MSPQSNTSLLNGSEKISQYFPESNYSFRPGNLTATQKLIHTPGGSLLTVFPKKIFVREDLKETVFIAGVQFSYQGLLLLKNFYSYLETNQNNRLECVDGRLIASSFSACHEHCGACEACAELLGLKDGHAVEDFIMGIKGASLENEQKIIPELINHRAMGILISFGTTAYTVNEKEAVISHDGSVPFNVTFPFEEMDKFTENLSVKNKEIFLQSMLDWNIGIVLKLITGDHNDRAAEVKANGLNLQMVGVMDQVERQPIIIKYMKESGIGIQHLSSDFKA